MREADLAEGQDAALKGCFLISRAACVRPLQQGPSLKMGRVEVTSCPVALSAQGTKWVPEMGSGIPAEPEIQSSVGSRRALGPRLRLWGGLSLACRGALDTANAMSGRNLRSSDSQDRAGLGVIGTQRFPAHLSTQQEQLAGWEKRLGDTAAGAPGGLLGWGLLPECVSGSEKSSGLRV